MPAETKPVKRVPLLAPHSFIYPFIRSSLPVSLIQQCGQQVLSLSPPGEKQIPEEECNKAPSLSVCPSLPLSKCVCAVTGRWAVLQSLPNKLVHTHTQGKQTMTINLCKIQAVQALDSSFSQTGLRLI